MEVIVVRHGIALDREEAARVALPDRDRPLTRKGRSRTKRVARCLAERAPAVAALLTSPLLRAIETARILGKAYDLSYRETAALLPDAEPEKLAAVLGDSGISPVAIVGHEPHLSRFIGWALTGEPRSIVDLAKSGACLVRFDGAPRACQGKIVWLLPPSLLR